MPPPIKSQILVLATDKASGVLTAIGRSAGGIGLALAGMAAAGTAALGAITAKAVSVASEFEDEMATMALAAKGAGATLEEIEGFALKMGAETVFSAAEAAEAMTGLFKTGMNAREVMGDMSGDSGVLAAAMNLAAAAELDLAQSSDIVSIAMKTFGIEADDATKIVDNYVRAADASVAEVEDLASAMQNIGPVAAQFGIPMEDLNTALAILSQRGIQGAQAGTALKSMFTSMMRPTDQVQDALRALGISLYDTEGNMRTLPQIVSQFEQALNGARTVMIETSGRTEEQNKELERLQGLYESTSRRISDYEHGIKGATMTEKTRQRTLAGLQTQLAAIGGEISDLKGIESTYEKQVVSLTEKQRHQAIQTVAGFRGMLGLNTLLQEGTAGWQEMEQAIAEASSASAYAEARMGTFSGVMEALKGTLETTLITAGKPLIEEFLKPLVMWINSSVMPAVNAWVNNSLVPAIGAIKEWAVETGPLLLDWFGRIRDFLGEINFGQVISDLSEGDFSSLAELFSLTGIEFDFEPFERVADVLAELDGIMKTKVMPTFDMISGFIKTSIVPAFVTMAKWLGDKVPKAIETMGVWLRDKLGTPLVAVENIVKAFFEGGLPAAIEVASGWFDYFSTRISEWWFVNVQPTLNTFKTWWDATWPIVQAVALTAWTVISDIVMSFVGVMVGQVWPQIQRVIKAINDAMSAMGITWGDVFNTLKTVVATVFAGIGVLITAVIGIIAGLVTAVVTAVAAIIEWFTKIYVAWKEFSAASQRLLGGLGEFIMGLFTGDFARMFAGLGDVVRGLVEVFMTQFNLMVTIIGGAVEVILDTVSGFIEGMVGFFMDLYNRLIGHSIVTDLTEGIMNAFAGVRDFLKAVWEKIKQWFVDPFVEGIEAIASAIKIVIDKIAQFIDKINIFKDIKIPEWAKPGSPPPLETALRGIAAAMQEVGRTMPAFRGLGETAMRTGDAGAGPRPMAGGRTAGRGDVTIIIHHLSLPGVQNSRGLIRELQRLALPGGAG